MSSILSSNPVQLWLDTPIGAFCGSPTWGNNFEVLLGKNTNDAPIFLQQVLTKMGIDLGNDFKLVEQLEILKIGNEDIAIAVYYHDSLIAFSELII